MKNSLLMATILFAMAHVALSQNWVLTNSGTNDWWCIASSADGNTLIAGQWGGDVAVSTNAGATWTTNITGGYWSSVAASADGTKLLAAEAQASGVYLSTNSGVSWVSNSLPDLWWGSVAMSADGKTIAAAGIQDSGTGSIFCSTNSGATWTSNSLSFACGVAMSADGRKIFAAGALQLSYSTNFGTSWIVMTNAPPCYGGFISPSQYIASSADGNKLVMSVATADGTPYSIYTSADSGNTWNLTSVPGGSWTRVASSADGDTLMAVGYPINPSSPLYISTNSGASWTANTNEIWAAPACSADGGALVAVGYASIDPYSAAIYRSQSTQPPCSQTWSLTNAGTNDWVCVASSADGSTLIAGQWLGSVAVSTNAGETWTAVMTNGSWYSVAASADGTKLLAAAAAGGTGPQINGVFMSTNSGLSWISNSLPASYWSSVAISADGKTMAAAGIPGPLSDGFVFCSTNSGATWTSNNLSFACGVAMSADGQKIFCTGTLQLSYSTNFGASWMVMTSAPSCYGGFVSPSQYIASSADGNKLVMSVSTENGAPYLIYTSTNSGMTWNLAPVPGTNWTYVALSADGKTLMAAGFGWVTAGGLGGEKPCPLYVSTNSGASWFSISVTNENWTDVACSADGGALIAVAASDANMDANSGAIYRSQFIQPPLMSANPCGNDLLLSWLIPSTNFVLEQSADFENWSAVTNAPALNMANLQEQIVVSPTNGAGFYRLTHSEK